MTIKVTDTGAFRELLQKRLQPRAAGRLDVRTTLRHFALINYAVPIKLLRPLIPEDRFDIAEFTIDGKRMGMLSVVPFVDTEFSFHRLAPWLRFSFAQTNHRAYIIDRRTGEYGVWFFGTTLGSPVVEFARSVWQIPWHYARYRVDCHYNPIKHRYSTYRMSISSAWCRADFTIWDSGEAVTPQEGFESLDEMKLILAHPVDGFYNRLDGRPGRYAIWHEKMELTSGQATELYFSLYEELGLLTKYEMRHPHSIFIAPRVDFVIYLPPQLDNTP
ncbi:MAG: DUF2071 domain-containing protein [Chloroflexi bacterium]|nr:DUF2071 domain-containing protein [Chloroflexota bacterium]MCL5273737.1 DUF2071 domain-containing protein [Chloroflexota bacterium]